MRSRVNSCFSGRMFSPTNCSDFVVKVKPLQLIEMILLVKIKPFSFFHTKPLYPELCKFTIGFESFSKILLAKITWIQLVSSGWSGNEGPRGGKDDLGVGIERVGPIFARIRGNSENQNMIFIE